MGIIDYSKEPVSDIAFIDMKSFYASVECVERGLHPLKTSLCVMSRADNSAGLILASSPMFKKVFGKKNVGRAYDLPFDVKTRKFSYYNAKNRDFQRIQTLFDILRNGRRPPLSSHHEWTSTLRLIWKYSEFSKNTVVPMKYTLIQLMRALLT